MAGYTGTHNAIQTNYFQFELSRVPNMVYFCLAANLPGIAFNEFEQPTVFSHPVRSPVGAIRFDELVIAFKVDENLTNWLELHKWIKDMSHYTDHTTSKSWHQQRSDGRLIITNSTYNPKISVNFSKLFPIALGGINFNTVSPDSTEAVSTVKFAFSDYDIQKFATT